MRADQVVLDLAGVEELDQERAGDPGDGPPPPASSAPPESG